MDFFASEQPVISKEMEQESAAEAGLLVSVVSLRSIIFLYYMLK